MQKSAGGKSFIAPFHCQRIALCLYELLKYLKLNSLESAIQHKGAFLLLKTPEKRMLQFVFEKHTLSIFFSVQLGTTKYKNIEVVYCIEIIFYIFLLLLHFLDP